MGNNHSMSHADFPHNEQAKNLARQGKIKEALDCYDRALERSPDNDVILNNKAIALISFGRYEEALALSQRAASINPDSADPWVNMGVALEKLGRLFESAEMLERAVAINPYDAYARALLGIMYQKLDQGDRAEAQNRQLQEIVFPNEYAGFFFGTAAFLLGMLLGGIRGIEGKPLIISISSQVILLFFFCLICVLYWKSLKKQQGAHRNVAIVPYPSPVEGDQSTRGMYIVLAIMAVVFGIGILIGSDVWSWLH
jgi:tetratricopeptide (TPR) repeat protein